MYVPYMSNALRGLEYSFTILNLHQQTQIKHIEHIHVQRNAVHFVLNRPYRYNSTGRVTTMLNELNWQSLQHRRICADLILLYKGTNSLVIYLPPMATVRSTRLIQHMIFMAMQCNINVHQYSFIPRTMSVLNRLPETVFNSPNLDAFKLSFQQCDKFQICEIYMLAFPSPA